MSYCVNCGVELAPSEARCPLCGVLVQNPADPWKEPAERPYPPHVDRLVRHVDRRYFASLVSLLLLVPLVVCVLSDVLLNDGVFSWSLYVIGSLVFVFAIALLPLLVPKTSPFLLILFDTLALCALLLFIDIVGGGINWFFRLGMPIALAAGGFAELFALWFSRRRPLLLSFGLLTLGAGLFTVCVEIILNLYRGLSWLPRWSLYPLAPCIVVFLGFLLLNRRRRWRDSVYKRLFF